MTQQGMIRAGAVLVIALALMGEVSAQKPEFIKDNVLENACLRCHRQPLESDKEKAAQFVLLRESAYWDQHDFHRRAFDALGSPLGKQMSRRLFADEGKAATTPACLVCHATDSRPETPLAQKKADQFFCNYGVNCQSCHGPAQEWALKHIDDQVWREKQPKDKIAFGQVDLRNPHVRAEKCVSCHIGSTSEGKFVTHEMYAAGHPPLPPFELATFSRDEPRHWKPAAVIPHITGLPTEKSRTLFHYRKGEPESARLVAVGAIVALRESVTLLGFEADPAQPAALIDFAHFNCTACHHDLKVPSRRQESGFPGVPGRPVPQTWPAWTVRAVLAHAAAVNRSDGERLRTEFEDRYANLRKAFNAAPFGDRDKVRTAAAALAQTCNDILKLLDTIDYTEPVAMSLVLELARAGTAPAKPNTPLRDFLDADGAAQLARSAAIIARELAAPRDGLPEADPPVPPNFSSLKPDPLNLTATFGALDSSLGLSIRNTYSSSTLIQSEENLGRRLKRASEYDAAAVRKQFEELVRRLSSRR